MKTLKIILLLLFLATTVHAATIFPVPETFWEKILRCNWHLSCYGEKLGATITTINGSDTISGSRTTINTNFSNLNSFKLESASSSIAAITTLSNLTTIGTIISGIWNGTIIDTAFGGTGSSTPSSNRVLLGNGTGGINNVTGFGSAGQFLTSNGASVAPTWQTSAIDQTINYTWTGNHDFAGNTYIKNFNASSTVSNPLVLNGVSINTPSTQGASSTALMNNGSGSLTWNPFDWREMAATTTPANAPIINLPLINASSTNIRLTFSTTGFSGGADEPSLQFNSDAGSNYFSTASEDFAAPTKGQNTSLALTQTSTTTAYIYLVVDIHNEFGLPKWVQWQGTVTPATLSGYPVIVRGSGYWNNINSTITQITFTGPNGRTWLAGVSVKVLGNKD